MTQPRKNPEATRHAILDAAEQVFLERGVQRASLEEIARVAGVTRGAIYWHFSNKAEVFNAMIDRVQMQPSHLFDRLPDADNRSSIDSIRQVCIEALLTIARDEHIRRVFTISLLALEDTHGIEAIREHDFKLREDARRTITRHFEQVQRQNRLRQGRSPGFCASVLESYITGLLVVWLRNPTQFDMEADAHSLVDVLIDGLVEPV